MRGDIILVEKWHTEAAQKIVGHIFDDINSRRTRYVVSVAGESGSGKSETACAIEEILASRNVKAVILAQDDYFYLPPRSNDARRREDAAWLGPLIEVNLDLLEQHLLQAIAGVDTLLKPLVDYDNNAIVEESVNLSGVKVLIAEGTYTSLLKHIDTRVFIDRNFEESLSHRRKRNRGDEAGDPFIESILATEHKIIAGHKHLADVVITTDYDFIFHG